MQTKRAQAEIKNVDLEQRRGVARRLDPRRGEAARGAAFGVSREGETDAAGQALPPQWNAQEATVENFQGVLDDLKDDLRLKRVKQFTVWVVALTDEFGGVDEAVNQVSAMGDAPANTLPAGKYRYKLFRFNVEPRNYNVAI